MSGLPSQELLLSAASRINTGTENLETSRALVVFNSTPEHLSGIAVFRASMSWPRDVPLPPVAVTGADGSAVPCAIHDMKQEPDAKGRADRVQLSFSLCFAVAEVPAQGWRTYLASYADTPALALEDCGETSGLAVVETTRHGGDLAMHGQWESLSED